MQGPVGQHRQGGSTDAVLRTQRKRGMVYDTMPRLYTMLSATRSPTTLRFGPVPTMPRMPIIGGVPSVDRSGTLIGFPTNPDFRLWNIRAKCKTNSPSKNKPMRAHTSERGREGGREREEQETNSAPGPDDPRRLGAHCGSGENNHTTVLLYAPRNVTKGRIYARGLFKRLSWLTSNVLLVLHNGARRSSGCRRRRQARRGAERVCS